MQRLFDQGAPVSLRRYRTPPRAYSAEGRTPEHRSREAQRAACRSAAGRRSRPPLAAASAESEGPKSPIIRRERAAGFGGDRIVRTAPPLRCNTTSLSFDARRGEAAASELPFFPPLCDSQEYCVVPVSLLDFCS